MKKAYVFLLTLLLVLTATFTLAACNKEVTLGMELSISDNIVTSVERVHFGATDAYRKQGDDSVYCVDDFGYKGKTVDVEIRFIDGVEPIEPKLTVDGTEFTDFSVNMDPNNEFSMYIFFRLPCSSGKRFDISLEAEGVKKLDKDLAIDLKLPRSSDSGDVIVEDFAGTRYLDVISILAHKNGESESKYYTLAEIAQLGTSAPKATFSAHVEIARPVNTWIPIIHVKAASQYVNEYSRSMQTDDKESVITKMFSIAGNQLFITRNAYETWGNETDDKILTGNLYLSLEEDKLISGADKITIDASVMTADSIDKSYRLSEDGSVAREFNDVSWQPSEQTHNYGQEQTIVLTPHVIGTTLDEVNIDVSEAQVFVSGVEVETEKITNAEVHSIKFTLGAADSSSRIAGMATDDVDGDLHFVVVNVKLRGFDGRVLVWDVPSVSGNIGPGELLPSDRLVEGIVGSRILDNSIRYTFVMPDANVQGDDNMFRFRYQEFGFKTFKLQLTAPSGQKYKTDTIDALQQPAGNSIAFGENDFVTAQVNATGGYIYIRFGDSEHTESLTWERMSGYKVEFVETTEFEGIIQLECDFACEISVFTVDGVDVTFANPIALKGSASYRIDGVATDQMFEVGQQYSLVYRCYDADGNLLDEMYGGFIGMGGYWVPVVETAGEASFTQDFFVRSLCRVGTKDNQVVTIAKVVLSFVPSIY